MAIESKSNTRTISILGAGVGGTTTAIALKQRGFEVALYERTAEPATIGAGLVLWPNASLVLDRLGLLDAIKPIGGRLNKMQRLDYAGNALGAVNLTTIEQAMGYASYPVARHALQAVLIAKVEAMGIPIHYQHNFSEIIEGDDGKAIVQFDNGEQLAADIVIGADGRMKSIARQYVTGDNAPVYQGYVNWVGLMHSGAPEQPEPNVLDYWGVGERFGYVPIKDGQAYWAGCKAMPAGLGEPAAGNQQALLDIFADWPAPIADIIRTTDESDIKRIEVYDHEPIEQWYRNNVCLLGDAAHAALPTSGQGACQAIEDAWHMAECLTEQLSASPDNIEQAFAEFQHRRKDKTTNITRAARGFAQSLFNEDPEFCRVRNERAMQTDPDVAARGMAGAWSGGLPQGPA